MVTMANLSASTSLLQGVKFSNFFPRGVGRKLQILGRQWVTVPFLGEKLLLRLKGKAFSPFHFFICCEYKMMFKSESC